MKADDGLLFPILQPKITGNPAVVLVRLPVTFPPVVELAGGHIEPPNEPPGADLGLVGPAPDEIHDLIPRVVRNPDPVRVPQYLFLERRAPPSARPEPRPWSRSSSPGRRSAPARRSGSGVLSARRQQPRSRRTPSASGRRPWAASRVHRRAWR